MHGLIACNGYGREGEFHCLGAEYSNARWPYVLVRVTGTLSMRVSAEDLKVREGE